MSANPQQEMQIERYLSGEMSPSERRNFLDGAERDPLLKRQLQAEQLIAGAVMRDRASIAGPSAGSRAQFLSMLATVSGESPTAAPSTPSSPASRSPLRYLPGNGRSRGILAVIAGAALIVGAFAIGPRIGAPTPAADAHRVSAPAAAAPVQIPSPAAPTTTSTAPEATGPAVSGSDAAPETGAIAEPATAERSSSLTSRSAPALERGARQAARDRRGVSSGSAARAATAKPASKANAKPAGTPAVVNGDAHGTINPKDPVLKQ